LLTDGFGAGGGIARYNQCLMAALGQSRHVADVTILPRFGHEEAATPHGVVQRRAVPGKLAWSWRALSLAMQQRCDVIFCGHLNAIPLAAMIAKLKRSPLWVQVHGIEAWHDRGSAVRRGLEQAALVTSVSRYTRQRLLAWSDVDPTIVRVLPNTFAADFRPGTRRQDLAVRHGLVGKRVILTVGRLAAGERYKGHDRIIRALPEVARTVPEAIYLIVGSGDDQLRLQQEARQAGVADRVIFAGQVSDAELPDYFALANVFAMPSTGEGFGIVFLEAAASGLPVIGGNRDGSVDALADGMIGRTVDPDSGEDLARALVEALQGREGENAAAVQRFAFAGFADHVDRLVQSLGTKSMDGMGTALA
jgi:phosphatidylinositol alpha-1,6-mannosyltransferase